MSYKEIDGDLVKPIPFNYKNKCEDCGIKVHTGTKRCQLCYNKFKEVSKESRLKKAVDYRKQWYQDNSIRLIEKAGIQICERLMKKGFASTNIVLGIGSYTYQYNTRDTFGFAVKATYGEVLEPIPLPPTAGHGAMHSVGREIFKDPITDDGTKKSAKGLLCVHYDNEGVLRLFDQQTKEEETEGELKTVFLNGALTAPTTLSQIRQRLEYVKNN